jgi:hypothetical protein
MKLPNGIHGLDDRKDHLRVLVVASTGALGKATTSTQQAMLPLGKTHQR